jgi:putative two-component system response regulator
MLHATPNDARVLIVDDQEANVRLLERILQREGYTNVHSTMDPLKVCTLYAEVKPDLLLLDLHMPRLDGFGVMEQLEALVPPGAYFPILVLTADVTPETKRRALASGAIDFLQKPFDHTEVLLRMKNLLETRSLHLQLQAHNDVLEEKVRERTREVEAAHLEVLERLAIATEYRDDITGQHIRRVGELAALLADGLGLSNAFVALIRRAAPLHDVGKIGIPDRILQKGEALTQAEYEIMKTHTVIGKKILTGGEFPLLQLAETIALTHHECWDGSGYPQGLQGEQIPLPGRIVALVDAFDALTSTRSYKNARSVKEAMVVIKCRAGTQFDPRVVDALLLHTPESSIAELALGVTASRPSAE